MRALLLLTLLITVACRPMYGRDLANFTTFPDSMPGLGTHIGDLETWFDGRGYSPSSDVFQAESELRRHPGTPLAYALEQDRSWWKARAKTVQDFCVTRKFIYYKLDADQKLVRAIQNNRSNC